MKKIIATLTLALLAAPAFAQALKEGLWEIKPLKQVIDGQDMTARMAAAQAQMQQQMASMPPEQRKQMQAMLGQQGASPAAGTYRICVGPEMAKRDTPMIDRDGRCAPTQLKRRGNTTEFEFDCTENGNRSIGKGVSTVSANSVTTRMDMTSSGPRGKHTMQTESRMDYLGRDCQGVAPVGSLGRR